MLAQHRRINRIGQDQDAVGLAGQQLARQVGEERFVADHHARLTHGQWARAGFEFANLVGDAA